MSKGNVFTGARARLLIKGEKVGYARNISWTEEIQQDPIEVLDNIEVEEFVPTAYRVTLNAGFVRLVGTTPKSLNWYPQNGRNTDEHLSNILTAQAGANILTNGGLQMQITDNQTGQVIAAFEQVSATTMNCSVDARGVVGIDMSFTAVRVRDESGG